MLNDHNIEYESQEDQSKQDYPVLYHQDLELRGFISIADYIVNHVSNANMNDFMNSIDQMRREKYNMSVVIKESSRRMWLFIVLNEVWYGAANLILNERVNKISNNEPMDYHFLKAGRRKLKHSLNDINTWLSENIYLMDLRCYTDNLLACIISFMDYLNEIEWSLYQNLKGWYLAFKCKKAFAYMLELDIAGQKPPEWYKEFDF